MLVTGGIKTQEERDADELNTLDPAALLDLYRAAKKARTWLNSMSRRLRSDISNNGPYDQDYNQLARAIEAAEGK